MVTGHTPLEIAHWKTLEPKLKPFTVVVGVPVDAIVPVPEITDHNPTPTVGVLAVITAELAQTV